MSECIAYRHELMGVTVLVAFIARHLALLISCKWHFVLSHWKPVTLRSRTSTETKRSFATKKKECEVRFSVMEPMEVPVHKNQSCFANWVAEFLNHACVLCGCKCSSFVAFCGNDADTPFLVKVSPKILLEVSWNFVPFRSSFSSVRVFCLHSAIEGSL